MKTKAEFLADWVAFQKELNRRAYWLLTFVIVLFAVRFSLGWLPRGTFSWMPIWLALLLFLLVPFFIIHRLMGIGAMRRAARKYSAVCPNCGKAMCGIGVDIRKAIATNRCPYCSLPLYIA